MARKRSYDEIANPRNCAFPEIGRYRPETYTLNREIELIRRMKQLSPRSLREIRVRVPRFNVCCASTRPFNLLCIGPMYPFTPSILPPICWQAEIPIFSRLDALDNLNNLKEKLMSSSSTHAQRVFMLFRQDLNSLDDIVIVSRFPATFHAAAFSIDQS